MSDSQTFDVSLNQVYDFAYTIAQEFEKIVLLCDINVLKPVIEKVINVLEILENCIMRIELLEAELRSLKSNNLQLYSERIINEQEKYKLKQIYEESEESWLEEVVKLKSQLSTLKSENELLRNHLADRKDSSLRSDDKPNEAIQEQSEVIYKLKHSVKQKDKLLQDNISTISALNSRIQELLKMNEILHVKNQEARNDISKLIVEKNEARNEVKLYKRENLLLTETIQELFQSSSRSIQENDESNFPNQSSDFPVEKNLLEDFSFQHKKSVLEDKVTKLQAELENLRAKSIQHEANVSTLNQNKVPLSKIHQLYWKSMTICYILWLYIYMPC